MGRLMRVGWGRAWVDLIQERIRKGEVITDLTNTNSVVGPLQLPVAQSLPVYRLQAILAPGKVV